jgi:hypothetical protein
MITTTTPPTSQIWGLKKVIIFFKKLKIKIKIKIK